MPLYLLHGFRWPRHLIRIFIILNNLEDASADYIQTPTTISALRTAIFTLHPQLQNECPGLTFIEQHDPEDLRTGAQPYAFVADNVREAPLSMDGVIGGDSKSKDVTRGGAGMLTSRRGQGLSIDIGEAMGRGRGLGGEAWDAMADLRDEISKEEAVGWFAVWNGDVERRDLGGDEEGWGVGGEEGVENERRGITPTAATVRIGSYSSISHDTRNGAAGWDQHHINGFERGGSSENGSQVGDEEMFEVDDDDDDEEDEDVGDNTGEDATSLRVGRHQ